MVFIFYWPPEGFLLALLNFGSIWAPRKIHLALYNFFAYFFPFEILLKVDDIFWYFFNHLFLGNQRTIIMEGGLKIIKSLN
jgi:hypothetical protein